MSKSSQSEQFAPEYAGFLLRALAIIIDGVILTILNVPIVIGTLYAIGAYAKGTQDQMDAITFRLMGQGFLASSFLYLGYYAVFEKIKQATPGKMCLGIEVTDLNGNKIGFLRAALRNIAKYISALPGYVGFLTPVFTERKQALHDMIAGTLVVRRHQSKETTWEATHHKHKTSWTDPGNAKGAASKQSSPPPSVPSSTSAKGSSNLTDGKEQSTTGSVDLSNASTNAVLAASATPTPSAAATAAAPNCVTPTLTAAPTSSTDNPLSTPGLVTSASSSSQESPATVLTPDVASGSELTVPLPDVVQLPTLAPALVSSAPVSSFSIETAAVQTDIATAQNPDDLCKKCGATIDKNFSFCLSCMTSH